MTWPAKQWGLPGLLALIMWSGAIPLHAQTPQGPAFLKVCNRGTVGVNIVVAVEDAFLLRYVMHVHGWSHIIPGACDIVYNESGNQFDGGPVAYIGFGFFDSHGQFTAARIDELPDFGPRLATGQWVLFSRPPVLSKSNKRLCVHQGPMSYSAQTNSVIDCSTFHPSGNDSEQFYPLAAALHFQPDPLVVNEITGVAYGGKYYLNVAPKPDDPELHASAGTNTGVDAKESQVDAGIGEALKNARIRAAMQELGDEIARRNKAEAAQKAADAKAERGRSAQPSAEPSKPAPTVDDPIGGGGFIRPPVFSSPPAAAAPVQRVMAQLVFGEEIDLAGTRWAYADGTFVRPSLVDVDGHPPFRAREQQHSISQAPISGYIKELRDVIRGVHACTAFSDVTKTAVFSSVSSVDFAFDDYGVVESRTLESRPPSSTIINVRRGAALANLKLDDAGLEDRGCVILSIPCKDGVCVRTMMAGEDRAYSSIMLFVNTTEQGNRVLKALKALAPFYPDGGAVPHSR